MPVINPFTVTPVTPGSTTPLPTTTQTIFKILEDRPGETNYKPFLIVGAVVGGYFLYKHLKKKKRI